MAAESESSLPKFRYHPDPIASGSVVASEKKCECCQKTRGFIYNGPTYTEKNLDEESLCPWCIADGSASQKFEATFVDAESFVEGVSETSVKEITERRRVLILGNRRNGQAVAVNQPSLLRLPALRKFEHAFINLKAV